MKNKREKAQIFKIRNWQGEILKQKNYKKLIRHSFANMYANKC